MKRFPVFRFIAISIIALALAVACSKGSDSPISPGDDDMSKSALGGVISLGAVIDEGTGIVVPVEFSQASDLYAMSFRIGFDPDGLEPVGVDWGNVVTEEDATFHVMNQRRFIPIGFARYSGMPGLDGHGTLCRIRFRVIDPALAQPWIIGDREFLVARNSIGVKMRLEAGGEVR